MIAELTIHLHGKHYLDSGLALSEYVLLLMYESKEDWQLRELQKYIGICQRSVIRLRKSLVHRGYIERVDKSIKYRLTDKLYQ